MIIGLNFAVAVLLVKGEADGNLLSSRLLGGGEPVEFLLHVEDELMQALLDDLDFVDLAEAEALAELAVLAAICKVLVEL